MEKIPNLTTKNQKDENNGEDAKKVKVDEMILERVMKKIDSPGIYEALTKKLDLAELQSLLLKVYEDRTKQLEVKDLAKRYQENRFVKPCDISQKELHILESSIFEQVPAEFICTELSPVNPLGTNSVLTKINQKNVLSTIRNVEVIGDPTTALALECATKRRELIENNNILENVNLCTNQRCIRLQQPVEELGFTAHFKIFAMCTAGKDVGSRKFEAKSILKHIDTYLSILNDFSKKNYEINDIHVAVSDIRIIESLIAKHNIDRKTITANTDNESFRPFEHYSINLPSHLEGMADIEKVKTSDQEIEKIIKELLELDNGLVKILKEKYPNIKFYFDIERIAGVGYYENLCYKISAKNKHGAEFPLVDGGLTDWTKKLLNNKKERLMISGFGSELFHRNFKRD
jgi:hypothetical protein